MKPEEFVLIFNDRYIVILEENIDEIPEICDSKIVIVVYIDVLHEDIGRKLRTTLVRFEDDPRHPKAIKIQGCNGSSTKARKGTEVCKSSRCVNIEHFTR